LKPPTSLALALLVVGCGHGSSGPPLGAPPPPAPTTLGPLDIVTVRVLGEPETGDYQINPDGTLDFPYIGAVKAAGRTANEVAQEIARRLADGYLKSPQVTIFVKDYRSRKVTILGEVKAPGTFDYRERMSIMEAVSLAGGFTPLAAKNDTIVTRGSKRFKVRVEEIAEGHAANFYLQPGDAILVPERLF
jgi:polysaccharide export outer membrane protein